MIKFTKKIKDQIIIGVIITVIGGAILFLILKPFDKERTIVVLKDYERPVPIKEIQNITLFSSLDLIKEKFGPPHLIFTNDGETVLVYHFQEFSLKIVTKDKESILSITYLLKDHKSQISIIPEGSVPNLILGKSTFGDFEFYNKKVTKIVSSKDCWFYCDCYFGNPGNYWTYRIGSYNSIECLDASFKDSSRNLIDIKYLSRIKLNFVSIADDSADLSSFNHEDFRGQILPEF